MISRWFSKGRCLIIFFIVLLQVIRHRDLPSLTIAEYKTMAVHKPMTWRLPRDIELNLIGAAEVCSVTANVTQRSRKLMSKQLLSQGGLNETIKKSSPTFFLWENVCLQQHGPMFASTVPNPLPFYRNDLWQKVYLPFQTFPVNSTPFVTLEESATPVPRRLR